MNEEAIQKQFIHDLDVVLYSVRDMLIQKNASYGDSALNPVRIFARADAGEQIRVRIDDKLSRKLRGHDYPGEDDESDLLGYLVLLKVHELRHPAGDSDALVD